MKILFTTFGLMWVLSTTCLATSTDHKSYIPSLSYLGTFTYSSTQLPQGYGPPGSTVTLFQSPGIKTYFCQPSQSISSGLVSICLVLNNRFGSRFCNHHHGQTVLQQVLYHIRKVNYTKWTTQNLPSLGQTSVNFVFTSTTSGACAKLTIPIEKFSQGISFLRGIISDIYTTTMSDSDFDYACTNILSEADGIILSSRTSLGSKFSNQHLSWYSMIQPKWDCAVTYGGAFIGGIFGRAIGTPERYSYNRTSVSKGVSDDRNRARLCLSLFSRERDITLFICSSNGSLVSQVPTEMKNIYDKTKPFLVTAYKTTYTGYNTSPGERLIFSQGPTGIENTVGGTIFFGPISAQSLLASAMSLKLTKDKLITNLAYPGYVGAAVIPIGGQSTLRISTNEIVSVTDTWKNYISNLQSRYANSANSGDFNDPIYQSLIEQTCSHFALTSSRNTIPGDESNISTVLTNDCDGYVHWMQIFQGAFNAINDLNRYSTETSSNRATLLQQAASLITTSSYTTSTCEVQYLNT